LLGELPVHVQLRLPDEPRGSPEIDSVVALSVALNSTPGRVVTRPSYCLVNSEIICQRQLVGWSLSKTSKPYSMQTASLNDLLGMGETPDLGAQIAAELAYLHYIFARADEFYRYYREALLNLESNRDKPKPSEWIPITTS
jgi:hypothetical protein